MKAGQDRDWILTSICLHFSHCSVSGLRFQIGDQAALCENAYAHTTHLD